MLPAAPVTVAEMVIVIEYPAGSEPASPVEQTAPAAFNWQVQSEGSLDVGAAVNIMPAGVGSFTLTGLAGAPRMQGVVPMFLTVIVTVADWPLTSGFGDMDLSTERSQNPLYDADAVVWG